MRPALGELSPVFGASGMDVSVAYDAAGAVAERIRKREAHDVGIVQKRVLETLSKNGHVLPETIVTLARSGIALAVPEGEPKPLIGSADELKRTLLAAESIVCPDPAKGHASGLQFQRALAKLGLERPVARKTKLMDGALVDFAAHYQADLAITQPIEILAAPGYTLVGLLPAELQDPEGFTWSAGVLCGAPSPEAAGELVRILGSPDAAGVFEAWGMTPEGPTQK